MLTVHQVFQIINGARGRNRTTDTRIFKPSFSPIKSTCYADEKCQTASKKSNGYKDFVKPELTTSASIFVDGENADLRPPPYNKAPAIHSSYESCSVDNQNQELRRFESLNAAASAETKSSESLPVRTQDRFVQAAYVGFENGHPLNSILTINWEKLEEAIAQYWLDLHPYTRAKLLIQKIRKFLKRAKRNCTVAYIWVREAVPGKGEHLHVALHLPCKFRKEFIAFLERTLGEPASKNRRSIAERTKGEIACSNTGSWHYGVEVSDASPEFSGYWLAAYLAKGEPSERMYRGRMTDNTRKKERGKAFGGRIASEKYDTPQGLIEGTEHRKGRFSISRSLMR